MSSSAFTLIGDTFQARISKLELKYSGPTKIIQIYTKGSQKSLNISSTYIRVAETFVCFSFHTSVRLAIGLNVTTKKFNHFLFEIRIFPSLLLPFFTLKWG